MALPLNPGSCPTFQIKGKGKKARSKTEHTASYRLSKQNWNCINKPNTKIQTNSHEVRQSTVDLHHLN